ncbi:hypothetical protein RDWZM_009448 [Blomia tropicalis]|uniref:Threonine aspartase 1 n=1 Tax=Blomia tropicalis TaxID=40697 RepID=A0A9Q0RMB0_BLOTA|nr:hypothetical protein RDWZM_009448 [Blomia tropicalis]
MVFIAVHIGAGNHSKTKHDEYKKICSKACEEAMMALNDNSNSLDAVTVAIKCLENDYITNAGFGSNLNIAGNVECDACIMDGRDLIFGSVGAIHSIKNPIDVARHLVLKQREPMPLGLIAPNFLVGDGATKWANLNGFQQSNLKSDESLKKHLKYKQCLDECIDKTKSTNASIKRARVDTVGAISVDNQGVVSSGVSSGGLILKQEGRVGQASIFGAGCWAEKNVSISTSGIGEYIVRTSLAKQFASDLLNEKSPLMTNIPHEDRLAGVLGLIHHKKTQRVELIWAHSTASMCIGYMSNIDKSATSIISEMPPAVTPGASVSVESTMLKYINHI